MTVESANILCSRCSRPSCICWPVVANGAEFRMTTLNGGTSFTITANGGMMAGSSISLKNLSARFAKGMARHHLLQSAHWMRRVLNGAVSYDGNKKVKGIKRNIIADRNGFILARKVCNAGIHDSKMAHELCRQADDTWEKLEKVLVDRGYQGDVAADIENDFGIELEVSNTPNGARDFFQNLCDGWSNELLHGSILADGSHVTMRF